MKLTKKQKKKLIETIIMIIIIIGFYYKEEVIDKKEREKENIQERVNTNVDGELTVTFIDVGQADSILISNNNENMLIDAGNNKDGKLLVNYIKEQGINDFKFVVATHPHEDHIGGMDNIINNFNINTFYMPEVIANSKTFEDMLDALSNKNMKFYTPTIDEKFKVGEAEIKVLFVGEDQENLNDASIVLKLYYGETSYLFMGDASTKIEREILDKNISADVLKVGHHGSEYSTSTNFLNKVNPKYAIISVGKDNSYDHPKDITIKKLNNIVKKIYRTDKDKTIISKSDGKTIKFETKETNTNG